MTENAPKERDDIYFVKVFKEENGTSTVLVQVCDKSKYRYSCPTAPTHKFINKCVEKSLTRYILSSPNA